MKRAQLQRRILLVLVDVVLLYLSLCLALILRFGTFPSGYTWAIHLGPFSLAFLGWLLIFYVAGLYGLDEPFDILTLGKKLLNAVAVAVLGTMGFFYVFADFYITPKTVLVIFGFIFAILFYGWRALYGRIARNAYPNARVGFIGFNEVVGELLGELEEVPRHGYSTAFVYQAPGRDMPETTYPVYMHPSKVVEAVRRGEVSVLVITDEPIRSEPIRDALFNLLPYDIVFRSLSDFYELVMQRVPLSAINQAWFLENLDLRSRRWYRASKRALDIAFSMVILALSLPLWLIAAPIILMESKGPVLFRQARLGRNSRPFNIIKFRTMRQENNTFEPTGRNDPRVTVFGSFLRTTRIDELPQFVNILRGDMTLIGPRPERPEIVELLDQRVPFYKQRMLVKPGLTGWDQVSGEYHSPSVEDTYKKLQNDLYYIKNELPYLDMSIVMRTILTMVSRGGR